MEGSGSADATIKSEPDSSASVNSSAVVSTPNNTSIEQSGSTPGTTSVNAEIGNATKRTVNTPGGVGGGGGINYPKGKKRKRPPRDHTAPRQPLTGYVRFLNEHREKVRAENPNIPFPEITKMLGTEWTNMPQQDKQQYLDAAELDRERYLQELSAYKQTEAYKIFMQQQAGKKPKEEPPQPPQDDIKPELEKDPDLGGFDIPIFTEEFLDHNKAREAELRQLRKSNTDYEQQNAILQKHMENMRVAVDKLNVETVQQKSNNVALQQHLHQLRATLTASFSNTPLPGTNQVPTLQTIDSYMSKLHTLLMDSSNHQLAATVRDIVMNRLDIQA